MDDSSVSYLPNHKLDEVPSDIVPSLIVAAPALVVLEIMRATTISGRTILFSINQTPFENTN
jgi:hypothetical protein